MGTSVLSPTALALTFTIALFASNAVYAQAAQGVGGTGAYDRASTSGALDEIVVTAERRSENLQAVPITIEVASADQLNAIGVSDLQGLQITIPGLNIQNANGYAAPYLRGVGSAAAGPGIENPVAIYVDGVYYAAADSSLFSLNNIAQIEVLKGPQGTLFGRNATGGLIQVTTRTPSQEMSGSADVSYGNYDTITTDLYLTGGIAPALAADIAIRYSHQGDGYGEDFTTGQPVYQTDRDLSVRSKWRLTPLDGTSITLAVDYENTLNTQLAYRLISGTAASPLTGPPYGGSPWEVEGVQPYDHTQSGGGSLHLEQDVGFAQLENMTAYRFTDMTKELDLDATAAPFEAGNVRQWDDQISEEIHLLSKPASEVKWLVGLYYFYADGQYDPVSLTLSDNPAFNPEFPLGSADINSKQTTKSVAGFAQATIEILPLTRLTFGTRYTYEKRQMIGDETAFLVGEIPLGTLVNVDEKKDFDKATFRVALDRQLATDVLAFISFNTGFKSGGFEPSVLTASPFQPETLDAYEAGIKADFLSHTLRLNASAFDYQYKNIQVEEVETAAIAIINGAGARVYGLDLDGELRVTDRIGFKTGLEYLHARFTSFPDAPTGTPGGGIPVFSSSATGHQLPVSPDATLYFDANYRVPLAVGALDLNAIYAYNSGFYPEPDNVIRQPAYSQVNASARWKNGGYSVALWGKNLTNVAVINEGVTFQGGNEIAGYAPPRTYGITFGYVF